MSHQALYVTAAVTTAGVLGGAYCAYKCYKQYQKSVLPKEWKQVGVLKALIAYPIKSCAPIFLSSAECSPIGLKDGWLRDRVLMVVDDKDNFITAIAYPELLLVQPTVRNSILSLQHKNMETVYVNLAEVIAVGRVEQAHVSGVPVPVYDCGKEVKEWFSRLLNRPDSSFRLVYYSSQKSRDLRLTKHENIFKFTKTGTGALPDQSAYNLLNEASIDELNGRLSDVTVTFRNFRTNFLISGTQAYEEDAWKFVKFGENIIFEVVEPCTRCVLTTIDPETGIRNPNTEPLKTLKSYRIATDPAVRKAIGSSPCMGLQLALRSGTGGIISLNDPIYAAE